MSRVQQSYVVMIVLLCVKDGRRDMDAPHARQSRPVHLMCLAQDFFFAGSDKEKENSPGSTRHGIIFQSEGGERLFILLANQG